MGEEEVEELVQESGLERTTIEELLRKYGFGSWTQPEEVWRGRGVATYSVFIKYFNIFFFFSFFFLLSFCFPEYFYGELCSIKKAKTKI